jgi:hypothetical protein
MEVVSPMAYRLRLPKTYQIHPIFYRAYLKPYHPSPAKFNDNRTKKPFQRKHFETQPEFKVKQTIDEKITCGLRGKWVHKCRVRWTGYDETFDEWLTGTQLNTAKPPPLFLNPNKPNSTCPLHHVSIQKY